MRKIVGRADNLLFGTFNRWGGCPDPPFSIPSSSFMELLHSILHSWENPSLVTPPLETPGTTLTDYLRLDPKICHVFCLLLFWKSHRGALLCIGLFIKSGFIKLVWFCILNQWWRNLAIPNNYLHNFIDYPVYPQSELKFWVCIMQYMWVTLILL